MSHSSRRLAIVSSRVAAPAGLGPRAVVIDSGRIVAVTDPDQLPLGIETIDYGDLVVMPGIVDTHVHINQPGRTDWEGFATATRAGAAGGVTTLVDMPLNSDPVTTSVEALKAKREAAHGKLWVDVGLHGGLVPGNAGQLDALIDAGVCGIKAFLCDSGLEDFPPVTADDLRTAMPVLARRGLPLLVHAELVDQPAAQQDDVTSYQQYLDSRPSSWETAAANMLIDLCRQFCCRVHIVHLASGEALARLTVAGGGELARLLTVETCPHYLYFAAEQIPAGDPRFKCAPPIRHQVHSDLLWCGLEEGRIGMVVSDHSPCPPERKHLATGDLAAAWGGIAGLQLTLPVMWTAARRRGFGIDHLCRWLCSGPAAVAGLQQAKGRIATGYDADLVVWDPESEWTVDAAQLEHRHPCTPYDGEALRGRVRSTFVRGRLVHHEGRCAEAPSGTLLRRPPAADSSARSTHA